MPWTYAGKLRTLQNLTLRHPGHFSQLRAFYDLGLWDLKPVRVGETEVVPREVFHALFEPKVVFPKDPDRTIVRVKALGKKDGRQAEAIVEMIDTYDEVTGFTAMGAARDGGDCSRDDGGRDSRGAGGSRRWSATLCR
jgi:saccharopine dehydrogenase-like NADP-dependent oxidoreductase